MFLIHSGFQRRMYLTTQMLTKGFQITKIYGMMQQNCMISLNTGRVTQNAIINLDLVFKGNFL